MAGGLVANVALNATISSEINTPDIFVFPNMGDAGLAIGAYYLCGGEHFQWKPQKITSVYLGPDITNAQTSLDNNNIIYREASRRSCSNWGRDLGKRSDCCTCRRKNGVWSESTWTPLNSLLCRTNGDSHNAEQAAQSNRNNALCTHYEKRDCQ